MPEAQETACPVCSSSSRRYCVKQHAGQAWWIWRCTARNCRHGFVHPRPTWDELTRVNEAESVQSDLLVPTPAAAMQRRDVRITVDLIRRAGGKGGRLLDIGAGDGTYSAGLSTIGYAPHLIDLDERCGRATATIPRATFARETFEKLSDPGPYDLILLSQVLEHALTPSDWLDRCNRLLKPGGLVAILLPNFGGIYRLLGARDPYLIPPIHVNFFTAASLSRAMQSAGLEVVSMDSDSHIDRGGSWPRRIAAAVVAAIGPPLDRRARGIILRGVGRKA
jgi:SAM-dependent methyltransferase